jgi:hydrogenase maturation protease
MKRNKLAVIGLGNRLLADEGAGLHAIDLLREKLQTGEQEAGKFHVDLVEAGTPGMNLLHQLDEREKIIFIDAGNCQLSPGQYRRFVPDDVISQKTLANHSLHEFDLIRFLDFAAQMGKTQNIDIVIYCIQAAEMTMSENPSPVVKKNLPHLVNDVYGEIKKGVGHA